MKIARLVPLLVAICVLAPQPAQAMRVSISSSYPHDGGYDEREDVTYPDSDPSDTIRLVAAPGEANQVSVTVRSSSSVQIKDLRAPVTTRSKDCKKVDRHTVRCRTLDIVRVSARLGDRADTLRVTRRGSARLAGTSVFAGAGNDRVSLIGRAGGNGTLRGEAGDDALSGGTYKDELIGGPGRDRLSGNGGNDALDAADGPRRVGNDTVIGGSGHDSVVYTSRDIRTDIDLRAGRAGAARERDVLTGVEDVDTGGAGGAVTGNATGNDIAVHGKGYTVHAGAGDDTLNAGEHIGTFDLGAGDDAVKSAVARGTTVDCGPGTDSVERDAARTLLEGCELGYGYLSSYAWGIVPQRGADGALFMPRAACPAQPYETCSAATYTLLTPPKGAPGAKAPYGVKLGTATDPTSTPGYGGTTKGNPVVALTPAGASYLASPGRVVTVRIADDSTWTVRMPR